MRNILSNLLSGFTVRTTAWFIIITWEWKIASNSRSVENHRQIRIECVSVWCVSVCERIRGSKSIDGKISDAWDKKWVKRKDIRCVETKKFLSSSRACDHAINERRTHTQVWEKHTNSVFDTVWSLLLQIEMIKRKTRSTSNKRQQATTCHRIKCTVCSLSGWHQMKELLLSR